MQNGIDGTGEVWPLNTGQVYSTLQRLERDELVESEDTIGSGPQNRYRITDAGQAVYRDNVRAWVATRGIIDSLLDLGQRPGGRDPRPGRQRS